MITTHRIVALEPPITYRVLEYNWSELVLLADNTTSFKFERTATCSGILIVALIVMVSIQAVRIIYLIHFWSKSMRVHLIEEKPEL